ncbi:MAG TPA: chemotaxis protein CheB [Bdellovibrio sp.]|nr:chemotaxis protein CheB [Bdellovibrio sp.]
MNSHYLFPGKMAAFKEETVISTLLGSCVAVALFDPTTQIGGLNHYLLPDGLPNESLNTRYGIFAIQALIEECVRLGANRQKLQAKIYGGANVISVSSLGDGIGKRNIEIAENILMENRIPILEKNVAGEHARTIKMNTSTFEVVHKSSNEDRSTPVDVSGFRPLLTAKNVKVLVVDDSATVRTLFTNIFTKNGLEVVGAAADAYQARELILNNKPDVMTLDIEMPKMSGVMFLEKIMKHHPIPVVMVSSLASTGDAALRSLELGAVEFVHKPSQFDPALLKDLASQLVEKVRAAASVNVLKKLREAPAPTEIKNFSSPKITAKKSAELKVVVLGGNAGSADSLEKFIKGLAADTPPVVVSCSTVANFVTAYIGKVKAQSKVTPVVGKDGDFLRMGHVYFVPSEYHGKIVSGPQGPVLKVAKGAPVASQLPSSNVLFQSAAVTYGAGVFAVLLGGFGTDGVDGLTEIQKHGGTTIVQSPEEAQFPYGPQRAIELGVADEVLRSDMLAQYLMQYRNQNLY